MPLRDDEWATILIEGWLANYSKETRTYQVRCGQTILEAVTALGIPSRQPVIALVNGEVADLSYHLMLGDVVRLIPQIAGG